MMGSIKIVIVFLLIFSSKVVSQTESENESVDGEQVEESDTGATNGVTDLVTEMTEETEAVTQIETEVTAEKEVATEVEVATEADPITIPYPITTPVPNKGPINYAKLDLKTEYLKGSRWSLEQKDKIDVYHAIEIVDISKVDVDTMSIRIEIHLRQRWEALDLVIPPGLFKDDDPHDVSIQADTPILQSLWSPNSFIPAARGTKIASFTTEQSVVNIFPNKTIVYTARLYTILGCLFDFQWYPLDKQICNLTIESYTSTSKQVAYLWETNQPPVVYTSLKLLQYDLHFPMRYSKGTNQRWARDDLYPYVQLFFEFERQLGHHVIQVFIPTSLVVILSWFSFWLGLDAVPGRITLLITAMLTLVTMHTGLKGSIPPVNYIKMMDIWMVGCMAFVFLALCEFVIVKFIHWKKQQELKAALEKEKQMETYRKEVKEMEERDKDNKDQIHDQTKPVNRYINFYRNMVLRERIVGEILSPRSTWEFNNSTPFGRTGGNPLHPQHPDNAPPQKIPVWVMVDRVSRALFPISFGIFNLVFWPYLIVGADNQ
ncbi:glycine receptor subunit alpha-4 [Folsomia candida]|uniref:Glycine receptor subunit alpha-3 n=1 Tax=Folsomia candida TaxID=158441 RepID=A0A226ELQ8_FOLCA|nr:glycine receptor subunit alpha-4 [Folsomia candida]OXA58148.1 Glycine receptor subunit alpha-3 [Folsomia candida]